MEFGGRLGGGRMSLGLAFEVSKRNLCKCVFNFLFVVEDVNSDLLPWLPNSGFSHHGLLTLWRHKADNIFLL